MPVSRTRVCPCCNVEKNTPDDFRDRGESGAGRPPLVCRRCRRKSPALKEQQNRNVERRELGRQYRADLATRHPVDVLADMWAAHPDGFKVCPPKGGCGRKRDISSFHTNTHQRDGLHVLCIDCRAAAAALHRN